MNPADLSDAFFTRWILACQRLDVAPLDLLRVSYSESGCSAKAHNPNGDAVGLIQFMPDTLVGLGWHGGWAAFAQLPAEDQVPYVEAYFRPWAHRIGLGGQGIPQLVSDAHCYVATFLPACLRNVVAAGDGAADVVLCDLRGPLAWAYTANRVLDRDGDGRITVGDLDRHLEVQCRGPRYDAIVARLEAARSSLSPDEAPTVPDLPIVHPAVFTEPDDGPGSAA